MITKRMVKKSLHLYIWIIAVVILTASPAAVYAESPSLNLSQYRGKVVYVDFWASWCAPCKKSFPWMQEIQNRYQSMGLQILAVNVDENPADAAHFLKQFDVNFKIINDPTGKLAQQYAIQGMPTALLFNADGKLVSKHVGFNNRKKVKYEANIRELLTATARATQ